MKAIVEKKTWKSHNYSRYVAQAVAAYLIAREKVSGIRSAIVEVEGRARRVELSSDLVEDVEKVAEEPRRHVAPPRDGDDEVRLVTGRADDLGEPPAPLDNLFPLY